MPRNSEPHSGYVGRIIHPESIDNYRFDSRPRLDEGLVVVTLQSKAAAMIDKALQKISGGALGYSIEPADTDWVVVDWTQIIGLNPGDSVAFTSAEITHPDAGTVDDLPPGYVRQESIGELVYQLKCYACGETIEVRADPVDLPTGPIECPECGDDTWRWTDDE